MFVWKKGWPGPRLRIQPNTISFRLTALCLAATLLITVVMATLLYSGMSERLWSENEMYLDHVLENMNTRIDSLVQGASQSNRAILNSASIQDVLIRSQLSGYTNEQAIADRDSLSLLMTGLTVDESVYFATFYASDGSIIFNNRAYYIPQTFNLFQVEWIAEHQVSIDSRVEFLVPPKRLEQTFYSNFWPYMLIRPLKNIFTGQVVAYVTVFANCGQIQNAITDTYSQLRDSAGENPVSAIRLVDGDGYVIASTLWEEINRPYAAADAASVKTVRSDFTGFTVALETNPDYFSETMRSAMSPLLLILLVILAALGILVVTGLRTMLRPLNTLTKGMAQVGRGDFGLTLDADACRYDDLRQMYRGFNHMTKKISDLVTNVYQHQIQLKSAQLESLTYQINPHFLYNTLQTIEAIAELEDIPDVQKISMCLSKMFRYNLRPENLVRLEEELAHLEAYFEIERIRFRGQIAFHIEISRAMYELRIPKFILQPIVENAILHGLRGSASGREVHVGAELREADGSLLLHVTDNGVGIPAEKLAALTERLEKAGEGFRQDPGEDSIGLANVHKRIISCCGKGYGLSVRSKEREGTDVCLCLPAHMGESYVEDSGCGR